MTEEEYFIKNYPDFCYGDKLLSPYWDLFEYGAEFGERQSEKKIADLKEINAILSESSAINQKDLEYKVSVIKQRNKRIEELEKENAELKSIAEFQQSSNMKRHFEIQELKKENAELKKELEEADNTTDCFNKQEEIIAKTKEIIKKIEKIFYSGEEALKRLSKISDILEQAEQFLKEIEK